MADRRLPLQTIILCIRKPHKTWSFFSQVLKTKNYKTEISQDIIHFFSLLCQPAESYNSETKICILMEKYNIEMSEAVITSKSLNTLM